MDEKSKYITQRWFLGAGLSVIIIFIKIFSGSSQRVEAIYSGKLYVQFAAILRTFFGLMPFSIGDVLYLTATVWIAWKVVRFFKKLIYKQINIKWFLNSGYMLLIIAMCIYIIFNLFWGINYNRKEIAYQLKLNLAKRDSADLANIGNLLLEKVNESKYALVNQHAMYPSDKELFARAIACYGKAQKLYPFLSYKPTSLKSSMYGVLGNYFGFTGYYNPFSGEAQVNTTVPKFILPYTTSHEVAHQLGYAKEEEANFVGYLAATSSADTLFHYSAYLDLFVYANRQLFYVDSVTAKKLAKRLLPGVKADIMEWRNFLQRHKNPFEPVIRWVYGNYLKANQQPKGMTSYDEVIADLIAFYKKFGKI